MNDTAKPQSAEPHFPAEFLDSEAFAGAKFPRDWLVRQILVAGQPAVIGGPKKSMKTSIAVDLAISLGTGTPFLGTFAVPKAVRVALLSGESGGAALQDTARRICAAREERLDGGCRVHWSLDLPRLGSRRDLSSLRRALERHKVKVVIIDPLYLCLLGGSRTLSAANIFEVGPLLGRAGRACLDAGAMPVFVHHSTKEGGRKASRGKPFDLDDLAFVGAAEYARQWLLLARCEPYRPGSGRHRLILDVGGSAGHSGRYAVDIDEGVLRDDFTGRGWQVEVQGESAELADRADEESCAW